MRTNRLIACCCTLVSLAASAAMADVITQDTYIDSYPGIATSTPPVPRNTDLNSGGAAAIKVVTSPGSTEFPLATSAVRTLVKLPDSFWNTINGSTKVKSADVTFRVRTFNNGNAFTRTITAYPLLHSFVTGNGFTPTTPGGSIPDTKGGTQNTPSNPVGVDWLTYDGVNSWASPGLQAGTEYDTAHPIVGVINGTGATGTVTTVSWNIASLINDLAVRNAIQSNGLLFKITDDTASFPATNTSQQFLSFYSYEGANLQSNPSAFYPQANVVTPEPTTLCAAAGLLSIFTRRARRGTR